MTEYADLEIGIHRRDTGSYSVEFRFSDPKSEADVQIGQGEPAEMSIDPEDLGPLAFDPSAYGAELTKSLFADARVLTAYQEAKAVAKAQGIGLRVRLLVGATAPELNLLHWETLQDPQDQSPLSTSESVLLSRYLVSADWTQVRLRGKGQLNALVLAANPTDLENYQLAPVDVTGELQRAGQSLGNIDLTPLPSNGEPASLSNLVNAMRDTDYDIIYLACHGAVVDNQPWLWLENDDRTADQVSGDDLVTRLKELTERPRLVVLASCESAGDGTGDALTALGPKLAQAGVPAVLAMQGKIEMDTVAKFMPVFFEELQRDGQIDRALGVARAAVRDAADYWMPALFMRLKSGRIWYVPGFGIEEGEDVKWQSLAASVAEKTCTPIMGPALSAPIIGDRSDIARRFADKHGFPLADSDRDVLHQVAQYVVTSQSAAYIPIAYKEALRDTILDQYPGLMTAELKDSDNWSSEQLGQAMDLVTDDYFDEHPDNPYRLLARLKLPIYVVTGSLDLMNRALVAEGAEPVVRICPWNNAIPKEKSIYDEVPTPENPLVYHLMGHMSVPQSLVYSEDNYFDFLIGVTRNRKLIPSSVRAALTNSSLLFLGFQLEDREFRVFFRFIMSQKGRELLKSYSHVAAQIDPNEDDIIDVRRTHDFLEDYFERENIDTYWGTPDEFMKALTEHV